MPKLDKNRGRLVAFLQRHPVGWSSMRTPLLYAFVVSLTFWTSPATTGWAQDNPPPTEGFKDYTGPFPTKALYAMCSRNDRASRDKCNMYIQGLMYGLNVSHAMEEKLKVCLPDMTIEVARLRVLQFIDVTTNGKPEANKDSGDWIAFLGLASGNVCK
jgi:hypothetical protein